MAWMILKRQLMICVYNKENYLNDKLSNWWNQGQNEWQNSWWIENISKENMQKSWIQNDSTRFL